MVQKQTETSKKVVYLGVIYKYTLGEKALGTLQQNYNKWVGSAKGEKLMKTLAQKVQAGMRKIDIAYICTGAEFDEEYNDLLSEVRDDIEGAAPNTKKIEDY